jgi:hypothetical protein
VLARRENSSAGTEVPLCEFLEELYFHKKNLVERQKSHGIRSGVIPQMCFLKV